MRIESRIALRRAVMFGIAIAGAMAPQGIAYAQNQPAFEVSHAILLDHRRDPSKRVSRTPERLAFEAAQLGDLIAFAYGLPLDRVERRPQLMYDYAYDVAVTTPAPATYPSRSSCFRSFLKNASSCRLIASHIRVWSTSCFPDQA